MITGGYSLKSAVIHIPGKTYSYSYEKYSYEKYSYEYEKYSYEFVTWEKTAGEEDEKRRFHIYIRRFGITSRF